MAGTSADQATFAAQKGKSWADPNSPNWGQPGVISQDEYNEYQSRNGGTAAGASPTASGANSPITTAQGVSNTTANVGQTTAQGAPTTVAQSFQQGLVNRLNPQMASVDSPTISPALQAERLSEQRSFEGNRNLLAERSAAQGTNNSGGFETGLMGLAQDRAAREGQYAGQAVQQEQQRLDANQNSAMGLAGSLLSGQQNLGQQMDLANLDASLRQAALAQQGSLGSQDLALRSRLGESQINLGLLQALMGNQQFGDQLSQQNAQFGSSLDQTGLLALLNGL